MSNENATMPARNVITEAIRSDRYPLLIQNRIYQGSRCFGLELRGTFSEQIFPELMSTHNTAWRQVMASIPVIAAPIAKTIELNQSVFTAIIVEFMVGHWIEYCIVVALKSSKLI